jgi:hypothetical protein
MVTHSNIDTKEGLEISFALSYYSRMRLTSNLLPLLLQSQQPRVVGVLNGGKENAMLDDDLGLEKRCTMTTVMTHTVTMHSLAFELLAEHNKKITFLHAAPGLVKTSIFSSMKAPESSGILWRVLHMMAQGFLGIVQQILGISPAEAGERQAFNLTSDSYGPGAWRVDQSNEKVPAGELMEKYKESAGPEKVWEHTSRTFETALSKGNSN